MLQANIHVVSMEILHVIMQVNIVMVHVIHIIMLLVKSFILYLEMVPLACRGRNMPIQETCREKSSIRQTISSTITLLNRASFYLWFMESFIIKAKTFSARTVQINMIHIALLYPRIHCFCSVDDDKFPSNSKYLKKSRKCPEL